MTINKKVSQFEKDWYKARENKGSAEMAEVIRVEIATVLTLAQDDRLTKQQVETVMSNIEWHLKVFYEEAVKDAYHSSTE